MKSFTQIKEELRPFGYSMTSEPNELCEPGFLLYKVDESANILKRFTSQDIEKEIFYSFDKEDFVKYCEKFLDEQKSISAQKGSSI